MAKKVQIENTENGELSTNGNFEASEQSTVNFMQGKLAVNEENVFQWLNPQDLLAFKNFADFLYAFYDNEMKVYGGEFGVNDSEKYKIASKEATKYLKIKELIFNEIKKRTDIIYEKSLVQN